MKSYRIFIAHTSENQEYARYICSSLSNIVEFEPYLAQDYPIYGENFKYRIQNAIEKCNVFIVCFSESALPNQWVNQELGYACARNRIVMQRISNMKLIKRIKSALLSPTDIPIYVENGANYILLDNERKGYPPDYLIGLLNSSTLNYYFKLFSSSNNVQPSELKRLPIKIPNKKNENIRKSIVKSVRGIRKLKYDLKICENVLSNPLKLIKEYHSIYNSPIIKFPSSNLKGKIQLNRKDTIVYVTIADYFECENETLAKCVEIIISKITDLSEIQSLTIPKNEDDIKTFVNDYYKAKKNVNLYPSKIKEMEKKLDHNVYKLYNIS
ncbi:unnamed protein product, partial [marine sediment metagenome]